jgi:hypothetical protein
MRQEDCHRYVRNGLQHISRYCPRGAAIPSVNNDVNIPGILFERRKKHDKRLL